MNKYKVSIITPSYNSSKTIEETIQSVIKQTYSNWELIIVDDGSIDNTIEVVKKYLFDERIKLVSLKENTGSPAIPRNKGIEIASGEFIAFLDHDDLWKINKLEKQIKFHIQNKDIKISYTNTHKINDNGIIYKYRWWGILIDPSYKKSGNLLPALYQENFVSMLSVMVHKDIFDEVGYFLPLTAFDDHELWIRIAEKGHQFGYLKEKLCYYRISSTSLSHQMFKLKQWHKKFVDICLNKPSVNEQIRKDNASRFYRYCGLELYRDKQYKLANLYLIKSISLHKYSFTSIVTFLGLVLSFTKQIITSQKTKASLST